jgi:diguanylate cyclase (GGDEF)-like protein
VRSAPRRRPSAELSRGRFRTLFFALLLLSCAALRIAPAAIVAGAGAGLGVWSVAVARGRGRSLSHTFVVCDWLLLGLTLALSGGVRSPLLVAVPLLVIAQLLPSERAEWPYLVGPSLLVPIVLAIADPALGGHKIIALGAFAGLVVAGVATAVDPTTGFYTRSRLSPLVPAEVAAAAAEHQPLALVCVRLDHFRDLHDFRGEQGSEAVVQTVARRLKRTLGPDDLAFRLSPDTLAFTLRGRDARAARTWAQEAGHEVAGRLIDRHRQTLTFGLASYPPLHDPRGLLDEALASLAAPAGGPAELVIAPAGPVAADRLPVAVAQ